MNPLLTDAFERAEDSFGDAKLLLEHDRYAGCVNRCYYSVYYLAHALLLLKRIHAKKHKGVIQKFSETYIQTKEFPERLIDIFGGVFQKRVAADYDLDAHVTADEAAKALADTR